MAQGISDVTLFCTTARGTPVMRNTSNRVIGETVTYTIL